LLASIPEAERLDSFHLALPDGEVRSAGAAAAPLVSELPGGRPLAAIFRALPGPTERAYRLVANNRNRISRRLGIDASCTMRR
jgi:predicted DCC family thiol-disulfide oxidoreductase YuxK